MKRIVLLLVLVGLSISVFSQSFKKMALDNSGCALYSFCPMKFDKQYSEDSSLVYTGECKKGEVYYGVICVKLSQSTSDLSVAENVMVSYLDYLKSSFKITQAAGYGKGHRLQQKESTRGIIDYWVDSEKNNWKIKSWTDGKIISVLYGYSLKELPESELNVYLDGFRFQGM